MCKVTLTKGLIEHFLPVPPNNYSYEVEQVSSLVHRVWIVNHGVFSHTDTPPRSVWGFVKSTGDVLAPKSPDKPRRGKVCHVQDIPDTMRYSTIVPIPGMISDD